ncbi:hypothetical protein PPL_08207 [Heterostelium album PN500]|uniref:Secreted protein n=1 Tax=Heterostelium pallidum (strain ATCC 26659 / Pp 5 / PN500) TaxID=670386 RepID=D3BIX2_HETP5|nr:hypothetical protein PPL_08207 [Heterostelium album PN500]EFA78746.1 hypothetical protein PPL_08207 [Heterostelium album PN500]|eukprot:XP_020430870.1 hypothetical protein PPL_08207 [Heterostelium album PN500]
MKFSIFIITLATIIICLGNVGIALNIRPKDKYYVSMPEEGDSTRAYARISYFAGRQCEERFYDLYYWTNSCVEGNRIFECIQGGNTMTEYQYPGDNNCSTSEGEPTITTYSIGCQGTTSFSCESQ